MKKQFEQWLSHAIREYNKPGVIAYNFNLYEEWTEEEEENGKFSVQLIGASAYDHDNDDWACKEVFSSKEDLFVFVADDWEKCLEIVKELIEEYLIHGEERHFLLEAKAVSYGFVDGDLEVIRNS